MGRMREAAIKTAFGGWLSALMLIGHGFFSSTLFSSMSKMKEGALTGRVVFVDAP